MTIEDLDGLMQNIDKFEKTPFIFLGEGSNTVFVDDFDGIVVLNKLTGISVFEDEGFFHINVASGENWHQFVKYCLKNKMYGLENLALIPGTVGAAPMQNIGAYGVEVNQFIHSVEFVDIDSKRMGYFNNKECEFGYRDSIFKQDRPGRRIITSVNFAIPKDYQACINYAPLNQLTDPTPQAIFDAVINIRQQKLPDPKVQGNAGSFFKNPVIDLPHYIHIQSVYPDIPHYPAPDGKIKVPAAWLIDQLGFKGHHIGNIACHANQPLVLVNTGEGNGNDLLNLAKQIKRKVLATFNIALHNEVQLIGKSGPVTL